MSKAKQIIEGYANLVRSVAGSPNQDIENLAAERFATCKKCEQLSITSQCKLCGCYMPSKTRVDQAKCPVGKW